MNTYQSLLSRVRMVRRKWRMQALVRGVSLLLAATVALLVLGVWGADLFGFKPAAVWAMRVIIGGSTLYIAYRFFVAPLLRRVSDVQVAQYIEEHYPQLQDRLVTAVELGEQGKESGGMLHLLVRDALENVRRMDFSVFVDRRRVATYAVAGGGSLLALLALLNWGPSFFPYGFDRLYVPWAEASSNSRSAIMVVPGNADMAKGADQQIKAQLVGFDSPDVRLLTRSGSADWSSFAMQPEPRGSGFMYLLIDVQGSVEYYVEANGIRSPEYRLNVVDLPRVEKLTLTYDFPAYTGMAAQTVEGEGDISALKGTKITVALKMNQAASSARLLFDNQSTPGPACRRRRPRVHRLVSTCRAPVPTSSNSRRPADAATRVRPNTRSRRWKMPPDRFDYQADARPARHQRRRGLLRTEVGGRHRYGQTRAPTSPSTAARRRRSRSTTANRASRRLRPPTRSFSRSSGFSREMSFRTTARPPTTTT